MSASTGRGALLDPEDPAKLTPEARTLEVAQIVATGYLRLRIAGGGAAPKSSVSQRFEPVRSPENVLRPRRRRSVHGPAERRAQKAAPRGGRHE